MNENLLAARKLAAEIQYRLVSEQLEAVRLCIDNPRMYEKHREYALKTLIDIKAEVAYLANLIMDE